MDLSQLVTEQRNPATMALDLMSSLELVTAINWEDAKVPEAIRPCLPVIAAFVDRIVDALGAAGDWSTSVRAPAAGWACSTRPSARRHTTSIRGWWWG